RARAGGGGSRSRDRRTEGPPRGATARCLSVLVRALQRRSSSSPVRPTARSSIFSLAFSKLPGFRARALSSSRGTLPRLLTTGRELCVPAIVRDDNALHERVSYHVDLGELAEGDALDVLQELAGFGQAAPSAVRQVNLRDIARHDGA